MLSFLDSGTGVPILWIHGFPHSAALFEPQTAIARARHIRIDLPGFGATPPPVADPGMAGYSAAAIAVLDALGLPQVIVAGVSMGGYIIMQMLRDAPDRIRGLILIDTREQADSDAAREDRFKTIAEIERLGPQPVIDHMLPKMVADETRRDPFRRVMAAATAPGMIAAQRAMASRPDSTATLRGVRVPALILCGERDPITPPEDARRMASLMRSARVEILAGAAHASNFDRPEEFNRIVAEFLESLSSGA
ncbi:MAG TPA: alpha/beta hydrolase [Thermoanaerobaculia bacterium]|nr:alpha/beta hydrolase [Thermoanaerobaculia bacterium]